MTDKGVKHEKPIAEWVKPMSTLLRNIIKEKDFVTWKTTYKHIIKILEREVRKKIRSLADLQTEVLGDCGPAMVTEKNGDISGLTDVVYTPSKAPLMDQWLTGVAENYRGRGIGKWVKSTMLLKIREEFPDIKIQQNKRW